MTIAPPFDQDPVLAGLAGITHGFFGRRAFPGPVSPDFDMSMTLGTPPETVAANRRRALISLGLGNAGLAIVRQIHSARVVTVTAPFAPDHRPEEDRVAKLRANYAAEAQPEADALVTTRPGLALGILTGDCAPLLFADPKARVIAACHAGRRGAATGIIGNTVAAMVKAGARIDRIRAGIGPSISGANYQLSWETIDQMAAFNPRVAGFAAVPEGRTEPHFDLPGFVLSELERLGIAPPPLPACTYADPTRFFSHRRFTQHGGAQGRQISIIALMPIDNDG
ncbi:MAG: polyphenol oxidase family protein [Alphaproteobacteria bacterium]|nr:polyphenol oxidase family protein [Alphaproteobacteria bacterium]